jgi:hypothetical protein
MPTDEAKLDELPGRFVTDQGGTGHVTAPDRSHPSPLGTWTIDPADSTVSVAWPKLRRWTMTGRLHGMGVIQLDGLTRWGRSLPAAIGPAGPDDDAGSSQPPDRRRRPGRHPPRPRLLGCCAAPVVDAAQPKPGSPPHRPLAGHGDPHRPSHNSPGRAALCGHPGGEQPRHAGAARTGSARSMCLRRRQAGLELRPQVQLDLAVRANRAAIGTRIERQEGEAACTTSMLG